ncbi:MAG TPA: hypothetical protein VFE45_16580, partial [Coriobacteriia bacterium]|nr:hypothetical protein [Coriobacteriia bacterium]
RQVMGALHDAAVRVRDNAHADDKYPADWLAVPTGATVTREVLAECERWLTSLGRPAPDRLDVWTNGARAFAEHLAALATDTPTEGGAR